jgi:small-conductance mechanosensitive channel
MVNWRENAEFFYGLIMVVSIVIAYFTLYPWLGMQFAIGVCTAVGVVEAVIGFAAFESEPAVAKWSKLSKK